MDDTEDDLLQQWGKLVQDYENLKKRKPDVLKVMYLLSGDLSEFRSRSLRTLLHGICASCMSGGIDVSTHGFTK